MIIKNVFIALALLVYLFIVSWATGRTVQLKFKIHAKNYLLTFLIGFVCYLFINLFFCLWFNIAHVQVIYLYYFLVALQILIGLILLFNARWWISKYYVTKVFWITVIFIISAFLLFYFSFYALHLNFSGHFYYPYMLYLTNFDHMLGRYSNAFFHTNAASYNNIVEVFYVFMAMLLLATHLPLPFFVNFVMAFLLITCLTLIVIAFFKFFAKLNKVSLTTSYFTSAITILLICFFLALFAFSPGIGDSWIIVLTMLYLYFLIAFYYQKSNHSHAYVFLIFLSAVMFAMAHYWLYLNLCLLITYFFTLGFLKQRFSSWQFLFLALPVVIQLVLTFLLATITVWTILLACLVIFIYLSLWFVYYFDVVSVKTFWNFFTNRARFLLIFTFVVLVLLAVSLFILNTLTSNKTTIYSNRHVNAFFAPWYFFTTNQIFTQQQVSNQWITTIACLILVGLASELMLIIATYFYHYRNNFNSHPNKLLATWLLILLVLFYNPFSAWLIYYEITFTAFHNFQDIIWILCLIILFNSATKKYQKVHRPFNLKKIRWAISLNYRFISFSSALITGLIALLTINTIIVTNDVKSNNSWFTKSTKQEQSLFAQLDQKNAASYLIAGDATNYYYFSYQAKTPYNNMTLQNAAKNDANYQLYQDFVNVNWNDKSVQTIDNYGNLARKLNVKYIIKLRSLAAHINLVETYQYDKNLSNQYFVVFDHLS